MSLRKFVAFFVTLLVASFAYSFVFSTPTQAKANWNGQNLSYDARDFVGPTTATANDRSTLPQDTIYYAATDGNTGYLIYFSPGTNTSQATEASYVTGDYDEASGRFSNLSPPETIEIDASTHGREEAVEPTSCDVSGIGWVICPVSGWIAEGMDGMYSFIARYFNVAPILGGGNGLYEVWKIILNIANICFIIAFLVLIYAQITGGVMTSYTIKKMLPRIIIAAILVNISYWICALAVDLSNILGRAVQDLFMSMKAQIGAANSSADDIGWVQVTAAALGGGSLAAYGLYAATVGSVGATSYLIIAALIPALFAAFVAMIILAGRQALITVLIVISPLAFVAYLLPNTEEWFHRWRKLFTALMVMFPAFAVIFGGAQLAGVLIIQNATHLSVVILGLMVQVIPLFITPFLIKLSSGLMGTIAGLANDKSKGVFDRAQNWANANKDMHRERAIRNGMERRAENNLKKVKEMDWSRGNRRKSALAASKVVGNNLRPTTIGAYAATRAQHREKMTAGYKAQGEAFYGRTRSGQKSFAEQQFGKDYQNTTDNMNDELFHKRVVGQAPRPRGLLSEDRRYGRHEHELHAGHSAHGRADIIKDGIEEDGEKHLRQSIANATPNTYEARLRAIQQQSVVDKGLADNAKKIVDAGGNLALQQTVETTAGLKTQVEQTHNLEQQAENWGNITKKSAEAAWDTHSRTSQNMQELRLRETVASDKAKVAQLQFEQLVEEARVNGYSSPAIANSNTLLADEIQQLTVRNSVVANAVDSAKVEQNQMIAGQYKADSRLLREAAGVSGKGGEARVLAKAKSTVSSALLEEIKSIKSTMLYEEASNADQLKAEFEQPGISLAKRIAMVHAAAENGAHGYETAIEMITHYQQHGDNGKSGPKPDTADMVDFKELLGTDPSLKAKGRDVEMFLNEGTDTDTLIADYTSNPSKWNISATRFAEMTDKRQQKVLRALSDPANPRRDEGIRFIQAWWNGIQTTPALRANVKEPAKEVFHQLVSRGDITDPPT